MEIDSLVLIKHQILGPLRFFFSILFFPLLCQRERIVAFILSELLVPLSDVRFLFFFLNEPRAHEP